MKKTNRFFTWVSIVTVALNIVVCVLFHRDLKVFFVAVTLSTLLILFVWLVTYAILTVAKFCDDFENDLNW